MTFLNPLVLFGLAAASIPILLHLLNLRKLKTIEFSTLRFLKELQKSKIRKLKLRQIILLILRTLIIISIVLAFARPTIEGSISGFENYAKTSAVILIDNSFSMDVSDELGNRFNQAKNVARDIMKGLKEGDEAVIIPMASSDDKQRYSFTRNLTLLRAELNKIRVDNTVSDLDKSLRLASLLIDDASNINKEIFIISDCQKNILQGQINDSSVILNGKAGIFVVSIGGKAKTEIENLSIDSVNVISRIFQVEKPVEVEARIRNGSSKSIPSVIAGMIFNKERVAQRSADIKGSESRNISLVASPKSPGVYSSLVEIESDALDWDNKRYFGFYIPDMPAIALVGDRDKSKFIELAIKSSQSANAQSNLKQFDANSFPGINLNDFNLVICTTSLPKESDYQRLQQFVYNGGSALIFADDPERNQNLPPFLKNLGFGGISYSSFILKQPGSFTNVDKIHPMFEGVFKGSTDSKSIIESPKIFRALPASGGQKLIEMQGGGFLSEVRYGEGKAIYCAVSPSDSWSTFTLTGLFPAIIYRSMVYLSSVEGLGTSVEAGKAYNLVLPKRFASSGNFRIVDPNGTEFYKQAAVLPTGCIISFDPFRTLGVYTVYTPGNKIASIISVNPQSSESVLIAYEPGDLEKSLRKKVGDEVAINYIYDPNNITGKILRARIGTELWQLFILLALLFAAAEMIIERNSKAETEGH